MALREKFAKIFPSSNRTNSLKLVLQLLSFPCGISGLTYRIQRSVTTDAIVFVLSGEVDNEHVARLQDLLALEGQARVVLDLHDVTLVDREAVQYLASAEATGVRIVNCPDYVRRWIVAENCQKQ